MGSYLVQPFLTKENALSVTSKTDQGIRTGFLSFLKNTERCVLETVLSQRRIVPDCLDFAFQKKAVI